MTGSELVSTYERFIADKTLAFLDIDGTLGLDETAFPGSRAFLDDLRRRGVTFYLLTNNSSKGKRDYRAKVERMGFDVADENILISTDALIAGLREEGLDRADVIGTQGMIEDLARAGIAHDETSMHIVMGYDTTLDYAKIRRVGLKLGRGARYWATHPDFTCPSKEGPLPDLGSFAAMFEAATGRRPERVFGKPSPAMIEFVMRRRGVGKSACFMAGDRLYTDFRMSLNAGIDFVAVLSGEATLDALHEFGHEPAILAPSLGHLVGAAT